MRVLACVVLVLVLVPSAAASLASIQVQLDNQVCAGQGPVVSSVCVDRVYKVGDTIQVMVHTSAAGQVVRSFVFCGAGGCAAENVVKFVTVTDPAPACEPGNMCSNVRSASASYGEGVVVPGGASSFSYTATFASDGVQAGRVAKVSWFPLDASGTWRDNAGTVALAAVVLVAVVWGVVWVGQRQRAVTRGR